jgi:hypothetical protein
VAVAPQQPRSRINLKGTEPDHRADSAMDVRGSALSGVLSW